MGFSFKENFHRFVSIIQKEEDWLEQLARSKITVQQTDSNKKENLQHLLPLNDAAKLLAFYRSELERLQQDQFNLNQKLNGISSCCIFQNVRYLS
jgi:hypothetical protein